MEPDALPSLSVFEVDGASASVYCQNLCLLSKLFLVGSKGGVRV